jgi:hypothetical protein
VKLARVFAIVSYVFSSMKSEKRAEQVLPGCGVCVAQIIYTLVTKCKNNNNKKKQ